MYTRTFLPAPRENAWTGEIELQESAAPYHDWNARISAECYGPNAASRVLKDNKCLAALSNNYSWMSFNFGPTLLSWMEEHDPETYKAVLEADKLSQKNFSGHGSAIAQVYNHLIMPLANEQDKRTQIIWGIEDFKKRFNRMPEGMWLAETACDTPTLELLAEQGIKFTILAPGQCAKIRKIGDKNWTDTGGAKVDPKRGYLCNLPSGKTINLFFYDGPISQGIAFGDTLKSGENFAARLMGAYTDNSVKGTELVHIATDGETYGHHQKFADMALAYCLKHVNDNNLAKVTIYGEFLEKNPPLYEAQIFENTSWSCFHGVERWRSDCGCNSGMHQGWHQKWRAPLRAALDYIRNEMLKTFEGAGKEYFHNIYDARNAYVSVVLNRSNEAVEQFLNTYATDKGKNEKTRSLMFMEMQLNAMFMYTSCGWFFDEISGIETVQIMQYAKMAMEYNKLLSGADLEPEFIKMLALAPSNVPGFIHGGNVYERLVSHSVFDAQRSALYFAFGLINGKENNRVYSFEVSEAIKETFSEGDSKVLAGSAVFTSVFTLEKTKVNFVCFSSANYRIVCFTGTDDVAFEELKEFMGKNPEDAMSDIQKKLPKVFTLTDFVKDDQRKMVHSLLERVRDTTSKMFDEVFDSQYPLLKELKYIDMDLPKPFLAAAKFVLTEDMKQQILQKEIDTALIEEMFEEAKSLHVEIDIESVRLTAEEKLNAMAADFAKEPNRDNALAIIEFLGDMEGEPFEPGIFTAQKDIFLGLKSLPKSALGASLKVLARRMEIVL
ncbi:alpha-amylase/alpha-mannosidase (GH57 family) [Elusimicrobium posterum]|uniref:DUF3536 domain-containing protein n=1 Tax=Elusimicrobium posterum TaxID=3116653 RepID=UPI003C71713A